MGIVVKAHELTVNGRISGNDADRLVAESGLGIGQVMLELISAASQFADPSQSGFRVGAVAQALSGALYYGANIEFLSLPLNETVHAEQAAVVNAIANGETGLQRLAVSAAPCGYCRQFLNELSGADQLEILLQDMTPVPLSHYLPQAFGPGDLGLTAGLMSRQVHGLIIDGDACEQSDGALVALNAARKSYAPYTRAFAGTAITAENGAVFEGSYIENAAFNPSLSPTHAALISAHLAGCEYSSFRSVHIAQVGEAKVDHFAAAKSIFGHIAPSVTTAKITLVEKQQT